MSKYGYIGKDGPTQAVKSNAGVLTTKEHKDLIIADKLLIPGQLELIQTQTITSATVTEFDLTGNYGVYFLTFNDVVLVDTKELLLRFSDDSGASFEASSYDYTNQRGDGGGTHSEVKYVGDSHITGITGNGASTNETQNGYMYFYEMLNSSKYGFMTFHSMGFDSSGNAEFCFGSGLRKVKAVYDAIQFKDSGGNGVQSGVFSLYGIKEY